MGSKTRRNGLKGQCKLVQFLKSDEHEPEPSDDASAFYRKVISQPSQRAVEAQTVERQTVNTQTVEQHTLLQQPFKRHTVEQQTQTFKQQTLTVNRHALQSRSQQISSTSLLFDRWEHRAPVHFAQYGISADNKGYRLLLDKLRWNVNAGLGKREHGRLYPIATALKLDKCGIGYGALGSQRRRRVTHLPAVEFDGDGRETRESQWAQEEAEKTMRTATGQRKQDMFGKKALLLAQQRREKRKEQIIQDLLNGRQLLPE